MQMKNFKEDFPLLRENPVVYLDSAEIGRAHV